VIIKEARACAAIRADRTALGPIRRPVAVAVGVRSGPPAGLPSSRGRRRIVFDKLLQVLRFGCSYEVIADTTCSATTIRSRRDEWIRLGQFARLKQIALEACGRIVGLVLDQIAVDGAITKAPGGGEAAGRSPVDRGKQGMKRSGMTDDYGIPLGRALAASTATTSHSCLQLPTSWAGLDLCRTTSPCTSIPATNPPAPAPNSTNEACTGRSPTRARRRRSRRAGGGTSSAPAPDRTPSTAWPAATNAASP
jgi:hypothetical protein